MCRCKCATSVRLCECVHVRVCTPVRETVRDGGDNEVRSATGIGGEKGGGRKTEEGGRRKRIPTPPVGGTSALVPAPPNPSLSRHEMSADSLHVLASKVREMSSMAKLLTLPTHTHTLRYATYVRTYVRTCATQCAIFVCCCCCAQSPSPGSLPGSVYVNPL